MKTILCTHNSGGVGKTTLAVHLAGILARHGDVLLIDCDDQADSWKFFVGSEPDSEEQDFNEDYEVKVIANSQRKSVKKLTTPNEYDYVILDMDTPAPNIVQVILGSQPDVIFIPISKSHKYKGTGENLEVTLEIIEDLEHKSIKSPQVIIVPLGLEEDFIAGEVNYINEKPDNLEIFDSMRNLEDYIEEFVYKKRKYVWEHPNCNDAKDYFYSLIETVGY